MIASFLLVYLFQALANNPPQNKPVLLFVSHEQTYYSEYSVMKAALEAAGIPVEVRSAGEFPASTYMIPAGTTVLETAATLPGGSAAQFQQQFNSFFGAPFPLEADVIPASLPVSGRIQDVVSMESYSALVVAGGLGALAYRVDGAYEAQGAGARALTAAAVQGAAEALNRLAVDALSRGRPVMAQCHGASLAAFWRRVPGDISTPSLLNGLRATGFPEPETATVLQSVQVDYRAADRLVISTPAGFPGSIITTRDWYPQTVAWAARSMLNMIESYPDPVARKRIVSVLLLHGGPVNPQDCGASNRANDVPCNYGGGDNLPADFTQIAEVLQVSAADSLRFLVTGWNLSERILPTSVEALAVQLQPFDVVIFFKHWSNGVSDVLQRALVAYAENGGGIVALHHALYNDRNGGFNKDILVQDLFRAESAMATWGASLDQHEVQLTSAGHFITAFGTSPERSSVPPATWSSSPLLPASSTGFSVLPAFSWYDERYTNLRFLEGTAFGRGVNAIFPLLSNNGAPAAQAHTSGFLRRFNMNNDGLEGRLVYFSAGERRETFAHPGYRQLIRNATIWAANGSRSTGVRSEQAPVLPSTFHVGAPYPNPFNPETTLPVSLSRAENLTIAVYTVTGQQVAAYQTGVLAPGSHALRLSASALSSGMYVLRISGKGQQHVTKLTVLK